MPSISLPPGPRALPLIGHLPGFLRDPLGFLTGLARSYGDVVTFRLGMQPAVLINDPALIDRVLRDRQFERSDHTRRVLASLLGTGLLSLEGSQHLRHRRLMAPAFHRERIHRYVDIMVEETQRALGAWQSGAELELREEMMRLTFAIVARSLFNTGSMAEATRVGEALERVAPWMLPTAMLARLVPFRIPIFYGPSARVAIEELHTIVQELVRQRRAEHEDRGDLLSMLIASRDEDGSALSDDDICAETLTMLLAGHDTTAHTLTWTFYLLTQHPDVQEALAAEVLALAGDRALGLDDLPRLPLTERIVRETLRLYPPSWWADRTNARPSELGGFHIPAHTQVVFSTWVTQRDARFFPDPERFDPDRFLPERAKQIQEGAYVPFGAGVHMCIGNVFALTEARIILASIAQRFAIRATPRHPVRPRAMVTLGMESPFAVVPRRRPPAAHRQTASHTRTLVRLGREGGAGQGPALDSAARADLDPRHHRR